MKIIGSPHSKSRRILWEVSMLFCLAIPQGCNSTVQFLGNSPPAFKFMGHETQDSGKKGGKRACQKVIPSLRNEFFLQGSSFTFFLECTCRQLFACAQKNSGFGKIWCSYQMLLPKITHPDQKRKEKVNFQSLWDCFGGF